MTKNILILLLASMVSGAAYGQSLGIYKERLAQPEANGACVTVREAGNTADIIRSTPSGNPSRMIGCYRVEIFFDTSSNARKLAYETYAQFRKLFPEIPANDRHDISYSSPKYTVRVGYFLTREEAIAMCGRLKVYFDKAYPRADNIEISKFAQRAFPPRNMRESLSNDLPVIDQ